MHKFITAAYSALFIGVFVTPAALTIGQIKPGYALEAYNSHTGDVHVMDTGLSYPDCVDAVDDRRAVWGTAIEWSCTYYR